MWIILIHILILKIFSCIHCSQELPRILEVVDFIFYCLSFCLVLSFNLLWHMTLWLWRCWMDIASWVIRKQFSACNINCVAWPVSLALLMCWLIVLTCPCSFRWRLVLNDVGRIMEAFSCFGFKSGLLGNAVSVFADSHGLLRAASVLAWWLWFCIGGSKLGCVKVCGFGLNPLIVLTLSTFRSLALGCWAALCHSRTFLVGCRHNGK